MYPLNPELAMTLVKDRQSALRQAAARGHLAPAPSPSAYLSALRRSFAGLGIPARRREAETPACKGA